MKKSRLFFGSIIFACSLFSCLNKNAYAETLQAKNLPEFRNIVYKEMIERAENIVIEYSGNDYKSIFEKFEKEEFINDLGKIDDVNTSDDFDYMIQNVSYMKTSMKGISSSKVQFSIEIKWRESLGQLQYVNLRVDDIIEKKKILSTESAYQRIKLVHDYIVSNVEYDSTLKYENAYNALKEGKSTCQGYSLLFYKMLTEVGIPCRYITGTGINDKDTGPHGWNIVKIGEKWYNIDVTWDDPIYTDPTYKSDEISREYFLKGSKNFDDSHIRDAEFTDAMFMSEYVMDENDFNIANDVSIAQMVLGNSNITQSMLEVPEETEKDNALMEDIISKVEEIKESVVSGNFKDYIVDSYNELSDRDKGIIISLLALILISIVYKIYRSSVSNRDNYSDDIMEDALNDKKNLKINKENKEETIEEKTEENLVDFDIENDIKTTFLMEDDEFDFH